MGNPIGLRFNERHEICDSYHRNPSLDSWVTASALSVLSNKSSSRLMLMLISALLISFLPLSQATIYVVSDSSNETILSVNDIPAKFTPDRFALHYEMQGYVVYADPPTACIKVKPPPVVTSDSISEEPVNWILLSKRSKDCSFQTKIENAQDSGYSAVIILNVESNVPQMMGVKEPEKLRIDATMVGEFDGEILRNYTYPQRFLLRIRNDYDFTRRNLRILITAISGIIFVAIGICILVLVAVCYKKSPLLQRLNKFCGELRSC